MSTDSDSSFSLDDVSSGSVPSDAESDDTSASLTSGDDQPRKRRRTTVSTLSTPYRIRPLLRRSPAQLRPARVSKLWTSDSDDTSVTSSSGDDRVSTEENVS